jgi:hypothetical protein
MSLTARYVVPVAEAVAAMLSTSYGISYHAMMSGDGGGPERKRISLDEKYRDSSQMEFCAYVLLRQQIHRYSLKSALVQHEETVYMCTQAAKAELLCLIKHRQCTD